MKSAFVNYWLSWIFMGLVASNLAGQNNAPSLISSSGSQVKTTQIQLQWSLGEVAIIQTQDPNVQLSAGFHQNLSGGGSTPTYPVFRSPDIKVFPIPTNSFLNIKVDQPGRIEYKITNAIGNVILTGSGKNDSQVNTIPLPKGIYFLVLSKNKAILSTHKIIKI